MSLFDPSEPPDQDRFERVSAYYRQKVWDKAHRLMGTLSVFYRQKYEVWPSLIGKPEYNERPQDKSPLAPALIDQAADFNVAAAPIFHREPLNSSKIQKEAADRLEHGLQAAVEDAFKKAPAYTPRMATIHLFVYNYAILNTAIDHEVLKPRPKRREGEPQDDFELREWIWEGARNTHVPLLFEAPAPHEVLMDPLQKHPLIALRRKTMKAYEIAALLEERGKRKKGFLAKIFDQFKDPEDDVEVEEWWSPWWFGLRKVDGGGLFVEKNTMGIQPFVHSFGVPASAPPGEKYDPVYLVEKSLLFSEMDTIRLLDQAQGASHNLVQRKAWSATTISPESGLNPSQMKEVTQGTLWGVNAKDVGIEPTPDMAVQAEQEMHDLENRIERTTFSQSAAGMQVTSETATAYLARQDKTGRKFKPYLVQIEDLFSLGASNFLRIATRIMKVYPVESIGIGNAKLLAEDIGNNYTVTASFANVDKVIQAQEVSQAILEKEKGLNSTQGVWRVKGIEDTAKLEGEIMDDRIAALPEVQQEALLVGLRERSMRRTAAKLKAQIEQGKAAALGGPALSPGQMPTNGMGGSQGE